MDPTFLSEAAAGRSELDDIDQWVDHWHDRDGAPRGHDEGLHDYLGMSWADYVLWVQRPSSLDAIVSRRTSSGAV